MTEDLAQTLRAVTAVDPDPELTRSATIQNLDAFNMFSCEVVRANQALSAAHNPDHLAVFEFQDARRWVVVKRITTKDADFVVMVLGIDDEGRRQISAAYRIYPDADETAADLANDAGRTFQAFLERLCIDYEVEGQKLRFVPVVTVPRPDNPHEGIAAALGLSMGQREGGKRWSVNAQVRDNRDGTITLHWPFAFDHDDYVAYVQGHGWRG